MTTPQRVPLSLHIVSRRRKARLSPRSRRAVEAVVWVLIALTLGYLVGRYF